MSTKDTLCGDCEMPFCHDCYTAFKYSPHVIATGLCNDKLLGYTTHLLAKASRITDTTRAQGGPMAVGQASLQLPLDQGHSGTPTS